MCSVLGYCGSNGEYNEVLRALLETKSRGPDDSRVINTGNGWIGFNRLSIMGLTQSGMQPFVYGNSTTCVRSDLKATDTERDAAFCLWEQYHMCQV